MAKTLDANDRLHSWKEIAAFLGHGVRTVQRWELERGLPVHRTPGGKLGSVYAFKGELTQWMTSTAQEASAATDPLPAGAEAEETPAAGAHAGERIMGTDAPAAGWPLRLIDRRERWKPIFGGAFLVAALSLLVVWLANTHRVAGSTARVHTPESAAVDLYLQGRYFWEKRDPADLERAVDLFTQAIVRDPQYAQPYAGLADCYNLLREFSSMPEEEAYPRALAAASRAIQLDPNLAEAHNALAFGTFYWKWDPVTSDREFKRAIELKPDLAVAHHWYANTLMSRNRGEEALREIETAQALDPSSTAILGSKGLILIVAGRHEEGQALLRQLEASQPDYVPPHLYLSGEYLLQHEPQQFIAEQKVLAARTGSPVQAALAEAAARGYASGGYDGMVRAMIGALGKSADAGKGNHVFMARLYALQGRPEEALQSLKTAYLNHEPGVYALSADPAFSVLHTDREFRQMMAFDWRPLTHSAQPESNLPVIAASAALPIPAGK